MASISTRQKAEQLIEQIHRDRLQAPKTIVFGRQALDKLGELVFPTAWGHKALVVLGARSARQSGLADRIDTLLQRYTVEPLHAVGVIREPTVDMVNRGAQLARELKPKFILSVGGGSVIDFGKVVAALAVNEGSIEDYLEGVGRNLTPVRDPLPHIAIPTIAGTGAEATKNAVIHSPEKHYKKSMRDDRMIPAIALVDPCLMTGVPAHATAAGGMDAITQLIESCISVKRRKETTDLAREGLRLAREALSVSYEEPANVTAREKLALASTLSGVCLANSGLAMAHGIAAALGALHDVPHGLACGILLPHTLRYNRDACEPMLADALAAFLNQPAPTARTVEEGIAAIENLNRWLQIPPHLKYLGLSRTDLEKIASASAGSSMSGNPIPMDAGTTMEFLLSIA